MRSILLLRAALITAGGQVLVSAGAIAAWAAFYGTLCFAAACGR